MSIHSTAIVHAGAEVHASAHVGPHCIVDEHVRVSRDCRMIHAVYLTGWTEIGEECVLHPGAIVGHTPQDVKYKDERSYCRVGNRTVLRESVTVHRGSGCDSETAVGADCVLLTGAHVGHNAYVGDGVRLGEHVLLAGHTVIGDCAVLGAGVGVHQFTRIGESASIEPGVTIRQDVIPFARVCADDRIEGMNETALDSLTVAESEDLRRLFRMFVSGYHSFRAMQRRSIDAAETAPGRRFVEFLQQDSRRSYAGEKPVD